LTSEFGIFKQTLSSRNYFGEDQKSLSGNKSLRLKSAIDLKKILKGDLNLGPSSQLIDQQKPNII